MRNSQNEKILKKLKFFFTKTISLFLTSMIDMIYQNYKSYMINIQNNILQYLDWENDTEEKFQKINSLFRSNDFEKNTYELKSILYFKYIS